jgi:hypothetical protein
MLKKPVTGGRATDPRKLKYFEQVYDTKAGGAADNNHSTDVVFRRTQSVRLYAHSP